MKRTINADGRMKGGQIEFGNLDWVNQQARELFKEDKPLSITIQAVVDKKTTRQNGYFHGVIVPIYLNALLGAGVNTVTVAFGDRQRVLPMNFERAKDLLKAEVGLQRLENGEFKAVGVSQASKDEMSVLIEASIVWLRENFGIEVPPPDPKWRRAK